MTWLSDLERWTNWLWSWIDWVWAAGWILAGVLATHLLWWHRHSRLAEREKLLREQMSQLGNRHREARRQTEEIGRREEALKKLEESLRRQTEQLMPQVEQIRNWLDQLTQRDRPVAAVPEAAAVARDLDGQKRHLPERPNTSLQ